MKKFKILYIHGLNSSKEANTIRNLRKHLDNEVFEVHAINFLNNIESFENEQKNIDVARSYVISNMINMVVASSIGAFTALNLSSPKLLINPCMKPSQVLPTLLYGKTTQSEMQKYEDLENNMYSTYLDDEQQIFTYAIFGTHDELFSYKELFSKYFRRSHLKNINSGHRLSEDNIKNIVVPYIKEIIKSSKEYSELFERQDKNSVFDTMFEDYEIDILSSNDKSLKERYITRSAEE